MNCPNCNAQNPDNGAFCVGCGQPLQAAPPPAQQFPQYAAPAPAAAPVDNEAQDAQDNKVMGILSYFGPLALIPFLTKKDSPFAQFHAKQGLTLCIVWVAYLIVNWLLGLIQITRTEYIWGVPVEVKTKPWFITLITFALSVCISILAIIGIINAVKGLKKELPLIGGIKIFK